MWFHFKVLNILTSIDVIVNRCIDHTWVIVFLFVLHGITIDSLEQPFPLKLVRKLCVQERKKKQIVSPSCHFHGLIVILLTILVDQKVLQKKLLSYCKILT